MASGEIELVGEQVRLRPILAAEIDELWQAMVAETSMAVAELPDEASFRQRLANSGRLRGGTLDLAIDVGGELVGRIQTFEPPHRVVEAGIFHIGIGLQPAARGKGYGLDAVALLTAWLFEHAAGLEVVGLTDPENYAMQAVFRKLGWELTSTVADHGRPWLVFNAPRLNAP